MSTPPDYSVPPPVMPYMDVPPPNIRPLPRPLWHPSAYMPLRPPYPSTYESYCYPDPYAYYPYSDPSYNVLPLAPGINPYPPLHPSYFPPKPSTAPPNVSARNMYFSSSRKDVSSLEVKGSPVGSPSAITIKTERRSSTPVAHEGTSKGSIQNPHHRSYSQRDTSPKKEMSSVYNRECSTERKQSREREDRGRVMREQDWNYRVRSRSPSYSSHRYRSPSRYSNRDYRPQDKYYKSYRECEKERYREEMREYERRRREYRNCRNPVKVKDLKLKSFSRYSDYHRKFRSPSRSSYYSHRESESRSHTREPSHRDHREGSKKPLTDREKILEEYR